jgi:hypothetical protein
MTDRPNPVVDGSNAQLPAEIIPGERRLTAAEFQGLADVPPAFEWFENLKNPGTKRIYKNAIRDFMQFTGILRPEEFRIVTRAHVIAWRMTSSAGKSVATKRIPPDARSGTGWRHCRHSSNISARRMPSAAIPSEVSSDPRPKAVKAAHRQSAIIRPASFSRRLRPKP